MSRVNILSLLLVLGLLSACQLRTRSQPASGGTARDPNAAAATLASSSLDLPDTPTPFQPIPPTPTATNAPSPTVTSTPSPTPPARIILLFTGVIVPARCVQAAIDARGSPDYIYAEVRDLIQQADLAVGTLNASINDASDHTGCIETLKLVGSSNNADALAEVGFDVMSVATNHIKDGGNSGLTSTLDNLRRVGIAPVGAGASLEEALQPVVLTVKGVRFGIVSLGMVNPSAFAGADMPGIAPLTNENLEIAISAARKVSDVVIAMPHWGPEDTSDPDPNQLSFAPMVVEAGADLVMGNHTHVVQAIQEIDGITIFYGLGNFIFDQTWDLAHQQGVILQVTFEGTHMVGYELIPTHVDGDGAVHIAGAEEAAQVLDRIQQASDHLK
jgi:poly-gamma-glutamate capsule biosynthesis protein CapA/YwtB (metallophosphatase superfamily)